MMENALPPGSTSGSTLPRRLVLSYAPPEAFASLSRAILGKLGYAIVTPEEFESLAEEWDRDQPDLRIVDERNLQELPEGGRSPVPIIVLTGRQGVTGADPRIAGAIPRPAGLHELYRLMQQILEDAPRSTPRIPTHLPATIVVRDREWPVSVLSLSENGCLIRSPESLLLGSRVSLQLQLPHAHLLELDAEVGYQLVPDLGLTFHATTPTDRLVLSRFVETALLAS